jgi:hypothetical protein
MEKVEIKLHPDLVKRGLGFTDVSDKQELRHKAGESVIVKRTAFVNLKIQSGEVTLVRTIEDASTPLSNQTGQAESIQPLPATDPPVEMEEEKKKAKK